MCCHTVEERIQGENCTGANVVCSDNLVCHDDMDVCGKF